MKPNLYLIPCILFLLFSAAADAQTTETFETEVGNSTTFTDNGQVFNITSQAQGPFHIQTGFAGTGWNGTGSDNVYIDNDPNAVAGQNVAFTIATAGAAPFRIISFYAYLSDNNWNVNVSGSLTITGKLAGVTKYVATSGSGFNTNGALQNGFSFIDMTTFGGSDNSLTDIDEMVITTGGNFNYVAVDAFKWTGGLTATVSQVNICGAGNNGSATVNASGGIAPYTYLWSPSGNTTNSISGLSAGTYSCTITDATNISITETVTIAALSASTSQTNVTCKGGSDGSASVIVAGGNSPITYSWTPSGGSSDTASGLLAGTYTCTITDATSCVVTKNFTITEPSSVLVTSLTGSSDLTCNGTNDGSASVSASGGGGAYTYLWSPSGGTAAAATLLAAGTYTCTITDANLCVKTETVTLTEPPAILSSVSSQTDVSCNGGNDGAATVTASGGTGTLTYSWSPSGGTGSTATSLTANIYTCTITDAISCVKTETVNITEPNFIGSSQSFTLCAGQNAIVGTHTYTTTGNYTDVFVAANGCDSTVSTNLNVLPANVTSQSFSICAGQNIIVGSNSYSSSGTYTNVFVAANGCDSTVTTNLTVLPVNTFNQTVTLCAGQSLTVGTSTYSVSGNYTDLLTDTHGCDSTVTTDLTVMPANNFTQSLSVCGGQSITIGANTHTVSGTYTDVITDSHGCDSTVTTHLTVLPFNTTAQSFTLCAGQSVTVGTNTYTLSGTFTDVFTAADGCDSTVTTSLTVLPANNTTRNLVLCSGQSVTVGTNTYSVSGNYTDVLTAANGCDSTVITNLTVRPVNSFSQTVVLCAGQSITVGTNTYTADGTYTDVLTDSHGCDSTVTTNLTVLPNSSSTQSFTLCAGQSVTVGTNTYTASGTFTDVIPAANGCDSTVTTDLTVLPANIFTQDFTVCAGQSVTVGTNTYTASGTYFDLYAAANGCDSTVVTNLTVLPANAPTNTVVLCAGQSITVGANTYTTSGTYVDVLTAANGCDSTVTTNLTVLPVNSFSQSITLCAGYSITVGTSTYTANGTYTDVITDSHGCDSTVTTNITVIPNSASAQSFTLCAGQSVTVGTHVHDTSGTFNDTIPSANGCDSVVTTDLTVLPANTATNTYTVCAGQAVTQGSYTYTATGVYFDVYTAANGCDSTIVTDLTVLPLDTVTQNITVCFGQSFDVGGNTYSVSGTYVDIFTDVAGCDSTVTTNLTILPLDTVSQSYVLCAGQSLTVGTSTYTTSGTFTDVLTDLNGCDSTVTTTLTVLPNSSSAQSFTICAGQSITVATSTYSVSGTFVDILPSATGCDSTITTDLTVLPANTTTNTFVVCAGQSVTEGVNTYTATGIYTDVYTAANGCDSIITTDLTVLPSNGSSPSYTVCAGQSLIVGTSTYTTSGTFTDVLTDSHGCDSTVTASLTVLPANGSTQSFTVCAGQSVSVGANTYSASGTYTDVITDSHGCDSTVITDLVVNNPLDASVTVSSDTITANNSGATYQWIDCNNGNSVMSGETAQMFVASADGNYAVIVSENSCADTSVCTPIIVNSIKQIDETPQVIIYPNPNNGKFTIRSQKEGHYLLINDLGQTIAELSLNKQNNFSDNVEISGKGIYFLIGDAGHLILKQKIIITE